MRFAILGNGDPDCYETQIAHALGSLGHQVEIRWPLVSLDRILKWKRLGRALDVLVSQADLWRSGHPHGRLRRPLLRWLRRFEPDVLIVPTLPALSPSVGRAIKRSSGCRLVGWFPDAVVNLARHEFVLTPYDIIYFKDPFLVRRLGTELGDARVRFLPEGFDARLDIPTTPGEERPFAVEVMVYGNAYPYRLRVLEGLEGVQVRMYGSIAGRAPEFPPWVRHTGLDIRGQTKVLACRGADVCLNWGHFAEIEGVNARLWELAGIGAFQVTNLRAAAEYFSPEGEVPVVSDIGELRRALQYYLERPDQRRSMAAAAREKVLAHHTWRHRAEAVLSDLAALV